MQLFVKQMKTKIYPMKVTSSFDYQNINNIYGLIHILIFFINNKVYVYYLTQRKPFVNSTNSEIKVMLWTSDPELKFSVSNTY